MHQIREVIWRGPDGGTSTNVSSAATNLNANISLTFAEGNVEATYRSCQFCGARGKLTREDIVPIWATNRLAELGHPREVQVFTRLAFPSSDRDFVKSWKARSYSALVARTVCENCNNGWMSNVEAGAAMSIKRMMGKGRIGLSTDDQMKIATWLTLKLYTFDRVTLPFRNATALVSEEEMRDFRETLTPPREFYARLGFLEEFGNHAVTFEKQPTVTDASFPNSPPGVTPARTEFRFSLGCVLFHCYFANKATPERDLPLVDLEPQPHWTIIWPQLSGQNWPPPRHINFNELPVIQSSHWWR